MDNSSELIRIPGASGELALIHAAERLFAEHGIAGVSLRQINQESGHKNMSAAHYHFGSREGLVHAIVAYREASLEERRLELLSRPPAPGRKHELRFYLEAYITPLAEALQPRPEGNYYLRFLAQYRHFPQDLDLMRRLIPAAFQMGDRIEALISYLPAEIVAGRIEHVRGMVVVALADAEARLDSGALALSAAPFLAENLIDMVAAALTAPVSAMTLEALPACTPTVP